MFPVKARHPREESVKEIIETRITELEAERDQFVQQANQQLAAYNATINELKRLIAPAEPDPKSNGHRVGVN